MTGNQPPRSSSSRLRFIYCTIGTVILCIGIITLVGGIVLFILSSTPSTSDSSSTYMTDLFYYQSHNSENRIDQASIIVAIVLASVGISFIVVSFVFAMLACFTNDNEPEEVVYKQTNDTFHETDNDSLVTPMISHDDSKRMKPIPLKEYRPSLKNQNNQPKGDINTIGLPLTPLRQSSSSSSSRSKVPPNGFSYLAHPSEIKHFCDHRNMPIRHQRNKITELPSKHESAI